MASGGWIPVVKQRGKQEARKSVGSAVVFTVFVDNLPNSMNSIGLFNLFGKFGVVKDSFIPQKRRRNTNTRFGFVRYSCEVAANVAVQKADGLWVDDKKLFVKLAAYERSREQGKYHAQKPPQSHFREELRRGSHHFTNNKTFADVVRGIQIQDKDSIIVQAEEYGNGWLYDSVLVRLKFRCVNISLKFELNARGIEGFEARQGGGRDVVLSFNSKEEMVTRMKSIREIIHEWCDDIIQWRPELALAQERLVWITCYGIPLHLWNRSNLVKIGSIWGEVIDGAEGVPQSFACGKLRILTKCMEPVNSVINLVTKHSSHPVRVLEVQGLEAKTINQCCSCLNHLDKMNSLNSKEKGEDLGSNRVGKPLQNPRDESTQSREGGSAQGSEQFKNEANRELTRGVDSIIEATWKSDTEVAESSSIVGKELEVEACKEMVAGSSAFNASKPAEQGNDGHVFSPGCMRRLDGSSLNLHGLNLEVELGQKYLHQEDWGHNIVNHGLRGPTDLGKVTFSENVYPVEEVGNSDDEISSSEDEGVVAQPVIADWANNGKTQGKVSSRPRSEKEMVFNVGPQGRFWKSKGKSGAPLMRSLSESSMAKPGLKLEVVLGCNMGSTDQVIHTEVGPSALLNKGLNKSVTGRKEGKNNRNRKRSSCVGKKDPQRHVPSVPAQSPEIGRDKGKKVDVAFGRSTGDHLLLENRARVYECGQVSGSKIKGQSQRRMRKLRSTHQFCQGFHRGAIFRAAAAVMSSSLSISSGAYKQTLSRNEAQETVKVGKVLGIDFGADEESVTQTISEMDRQDEERLTKKGVNGGA
ncbi:hypothetical protein CsSME_00031927 [Camellia sinensis var. sinensis]